MRASACRRDSVSELTFMRTSILRNDLPRDATCCGNLPFGCILVRSIGGVIPCMPDGRDARHELLATAAVVALVVDRNRFVRCDADGCSHAFGRHGPQLAAVVCDGFSFVAAVGTHITVGLSPRQALSLM